MIDLATFMAAVIPLGLGGIGWGSSIATRVAVNERSTAATKELTLSKLEEISRRLARIEVAMNGHLKRVPHDDFDDN